MTIHSDWTDAPGRMRRAGEAPPPFAGIWSLVVLRGLVAVAFGLIAVLAPGTALLSIVLLFAAYMLADGVIGVVAALMAGRRGERWGLLLAEGIADLAAGALALLWPALTVSVFVLVLAGWAIVSGALMTGAAMNHRRDKQGRTGRWWLTLGGVVSVLFGMLLAVAPLVGAVVLTWWLGLYALLFGAVLVAFGIQLRRIGAE